MPLAQISILGCGWLGQPLALTLQQSGYPIVATCRSEEKATKLTELGLATKIYNLGEDLAQSHLRSLFSSQILVLNIPVGRKNPDQKGFLEEIQKLLAYAEHTGIKKVIFVSTTSIYGEPEGVVTETSIPDPQTDSARTNLAIEALVKDYFADQCTILRLAGLVGQDRHPAKYLAGKVNLANPNQVVNLVHQQDVISAIQIIIKDELWSHTLHLCAQQHPTRSEYYTFAAKQLGLTPPSFIRSSEKKCGKWIDATQSLKHLNMSMAYPSPFDMIGDKA
jgi:nucleoside-diphosphate-sugar epimerase